MTSSVMKVSSGTEYRAPGQTRSDTARRTGRERESDVLRMLVRLFARMSFASFHDGRRMSEQTVANADARRPPNIREADADQPQRWS
ncbi:hypothetical protein ACFXKV_00845 [Streptomyces globisporus]|uniref:hypothetical protein n=1 Tax=Streptomyces TaxID=1883 RepID=UPI000CE251BF|nr:hypothetical protein [Streptomyces sp. TSRI0445]AWL85412.1 hypothetical protein DIJ69_05235 [Streptomyces globisporus]PPA39211.1 hypothetical protein BF14_005230 [Streptomyces griseus]RAN16602.1 hypothetical protein A3838_05140 [Streptomyces badius]RAN24463.1 hypothetical protein A3800_05130 [Streptomyces badius]